MLYPGGRLLDGIAMDGEMTEAAKRVRGTRGCLRSPRAAAMVPVLSSYARVGSVDGGKLLSWRRVLPSYGELGQQGSFCIGDGIVISKISRGSVTVVALQIRMDIPEALCD